MTINLHVLDLAGILLTVGSLVVATTEAMFMGLFVTAMCLIFLLIDHRLLAQAEARLAQIH